MGDSVIMRNDRRSKSQISIFDYPEHLNPFYEDDNHKRLRFWKIGKKDGSTSRRGSFSLGGIRDMWSFKSFRGKKKSSSLGINKTSESPEPVRRTYGPDESLYATYDPRVRNTFDNGTLNNNFHRNVPYRASLQDMGYNKVIDKNGNGLGFQRNDNYRSTIQVSGRRDDYSGHTTPRVPPRRYVYGGSVTPQPRTRYDHNDSSQGISRGSSQLSVASSNPFGEDDDDDDDIIMGHIESGESGAPTPAKRRHRKKRRAPPPPVPIPKVIDEESNSIPASPTLNKTTVTITTSQQNQQNNAENGMEMQREFKTEFTEEEQLEISNIAAEIEHFVKLLTQDESDDSSIRLVPVTKPQIQFHPATPDPKISEDGENPLSMVHKTPVDFEKTEETSTVLISENTRSEDKPSESVKDDTAIECHHEKQMQSEEVKDIISMQMTIDLVSKEGEPIKEHRKNSLEKPTPAARQHILVVNKLILPDVEKKYEPEIVNEKPKPIVRQYSPTESEESASRIIRSVDRKTSREEKIPNGVLPNSSTTHCVDEENNNYDRRSESSKEHTPLNSSYDTSDDLNSESVELKITESKEDVSEISNSSSERYRIRYIPLKEGSPETPPQMRREIKLSDNFQQLHNERIQPQEKNNGNISNSDRRRSVKEIIASINRSQSLLKVNKDPQQSSVTSTTSSSSVNELNVAERVLRPPPRRKSDTREIDLVETFRRLSQSEQEINRMIIEMESLTDSREADNNYCANVPSILDRYDQELNNNDIFKKCVLKKALVREGSPTTANLDWNPLPKPKRSKNLSVELNNDSNGN